MAELLLLAVAHMALTALPGAAAAMLAARHGERRIPVLLAVALVASGIVGLLGFWAYFGDRLLGESFGFLVALGSIVVCAWSLHGGLIDREVLRGLAIPLGLWVLGTMFLLLFGFVHGGTDQPLATANTRFGGPLPSDADIPRFYAEWFYEHGSSPKPPLYPGEWHFSDRPPLQVGYVLSQRAFGWDGAGLNYQVLAVGLQQLWIVGLWSLLLAAGVSRLTRGLAMVAVLTSSLAILNGFFVWPKLLPAAMLLAAAALVISPLWSQLRRSLWGAALLAALCGLAMLGHGSSVFGIIALVIFAAFRGVPSWRWLGVAIASGALLIVPWSAYQKWGDPPGDRLTKWTLAGVYEIDDRGVFEAIGDAYGEAGFDGWLHYKRDNFEAILGVTAVEDTIDEVTSASARDGLMAVRSLFFLYLIPSIGLFLLGPLAMAAVAVLRRPRGDPNDWGFALCCFALFAIGAVAWGLILFGGVSAPPFVHVISYLVPIVGISGGVAALRAALPRFAVPYVALVSALGLAVYVPDLLPPPQTEYSPATALLAALALAGFAGLALCGVRPAVGDDATAAASASPNRDRRQASASRA